MKRNLFAILAIFGLDLLLILNVHAAQDYTPPTIAQCETTLSSVLSNKYGSTLTPIELDDNAAIHRACQRCIDEESGYAKGVAWINSYPYDTIQTDAGGSASYNDISDMYSTTATVVESPNITEFSIYFHGQTFSCNQDENNNSNRYDGKHMYVLDESCHPLRDDCLPSSGNTDYSKAILLSKTKSYIINSAEIADGTLGRYLDWQPLTSKFTWSLPRSKLEVRINTANFINYMEAAIAAGKDGVSKYTNPRSGAVTYTDKIYVFRCPALVDEEYSNHVNNKSCGTDESTLEVTFKSTTTDPKTCYEKHQNDTGYDGKYESIPSWYSGVNTVYYNKCSGTNVLGSHVAVISGSTTRQERTVGADDQHSKDAIAYAKPGDTIHLDNLFVAAAQPASGTLISDGIPLTSVPGILPTNNWQNRYNITIKDNTGAINTGWSNNSSTTIGSVQTYNNGANIQVTPGRTDNNTFSNSSNSGLVKVGTKINVSNDGSSNNLGKVVIGNLDGTDLQAQNNVDSVSLSVIVPYNFTTTVSARAEGSIYFAGETANVGGTFAAATKTNNAVGATYATRIPDAKLYVYAYYSDSNETGTTISGSAEVSGFNCASNRSGCFKAESSTETLNANDNINGASKSLVKTINVQDVNAGKWLCTVAAIYPAHSGVDENYTNKEGSGTWRVSPSSCVQIAKKPTFQIWNGNLYARGSIQSNSTNKRIVSGHNEITDDNPRAFGSWVEHGIIAGGNNNNAGSGAVFGYQTNSSTNLSNNPGGHAEGATPAVCKRAPLTIANQNCVTNNNNSGNGNSGVAVVDTVNLDDFKSTATQAQSLPVNTNVVLSSSDKYKEVNGIRYFYNASTGSKIYLSTDNLAAGANYVVYSKGSVYINGNITYTNGGYTSPSSVPQLIIITDGSIFIDGSVTRVDAWLIAKSSESNKGIIRTCSSSDGASQDDATCSKQLRINGPIVARQLELNRVYGAATGNNSATPAEIINLSPATYVFSQSKASDNATLRTVYSKEIAPRW